MSLRSLTRCAACACTTGEQAMKGDPKIIERLNEALVPRIGRGQPVLAALPPARGLGLRQARQEGARGIDRGDAPRRQAGRAHHLPRRPSQPAEGRAAQDRPERQGSAGSRPRRRARGAHFLQEVPRDLPGTRRLRDHEAVRGASWPTRKAISTSSRPSSTCTNRSARRNTRFSTRSRPTNRNSSASGATRGRLTALAAGGNRAG
jgi:hypothetical protein